MSTFNDLGTKKGLLSYLQPGCDEENTKRQILRYISRNEKELNVQESCKPDKI